MADKEKSRDCCHVRANQELIVIKREKIAKGKQGTSRSRLSFPLFGVKISSIRC